MRTVKRDNLADLVASLTSQKGITTLDKSRVDWDISKKKEGDEHELKQFRKDGYVAKMAFLAETDLKQFEREKEMRNVVRKQQEKAAQQVPKP